MNILTVFDYGLRPRYYLKHPFGFIKETWLNIKAAWNRATKGYAWRDAAEMDEFLLHIIPKMLRDIADGDAYPGNDEFPTYESWQDWCNDLAAKFESVQEENWDGKNEYEDQWHNATLYREPHPNLTMTTTLTDEQYENLRKNYFNRCLELEKERDRIIEECYYSLATHHQYLWI